MQNSSFGDTEQLVLCHDRDTGMHAVIAIDDTTLGPGLGGVRWKSYPTDEAAVAECRRLASTMTLKHAAAGLPYGGAKAVINEQLTSSADRVAILHAFGRFVARLGGSFVPAADMGTSVEDLRCVAEVADDVACDQEDPGPWTALGVWAGIRAALELEGVAIAGARVVVQGAGHVGSALSALLARDGARVLVADVDHDRAGQVAAAVGGDVVDVDAAIVTECEVLAPCAIARVVNASSLDELRCRVIAGAANDVLDDRAHAETLARRGIVYVPDFVVNAGGVVHIHALRMGWDAERLRTEVEAIGRRVKAVLMEASADDSTPLHAAEVLAHRRLSAVRRGSSG